MTGLLTIEQFRQAARGKRPPTSGLFRVSTEPPEPVEGAARTMRFCFSDGSVDRMGDTIDPKGWDLADFTRNPVALWAHDSFSPPIGRAANVGAEDERLMGSIEFVPPETYAFADTIYRLLLGRFINAVSVGFLPTEYSFVENDPERGWGIDFKRQTLLEISVCPVPANANALAEARAKGIDTRPLVEWAERCLEGGGRLVITKSELDRLRKAAKEPSMSAHSAARRRATGASEDDPASGGAIVGNCGRKAEDECGMADPEECSVHAKGAKADPVDPDDEKALRRALRRLTGGKRRADGDDDPDPKTSDEPPVAHEDAIRLAHKSLRTSKAFLTEAVSHHQKAMNLLDDVVDALNEGDPSDGDSGDDPDAGDDRPEAKAARLKRAQERRAKLTPV